MTRILTATLLALMIVPLSVSADEKSDKQKPMYSKKADLHYLLYHPPSFKRNEEKVPLILFLHGAGERGKDLELVKKHGPPKLIEKGKDFPFVIVSPQCPKRKWWDTEALSTLLDEVITKNRIDTNRVYVTGLSMGGFGTWALATKHPERFAAIAPICGGGSTSAAAKLKNVSCWVFHGGKDRVVPLKLSSNMVDAIKKAGGKKIKLTVYPDAGHDSWTKSYANPELYKWFLEQKLSK